MNMLNTIYLRTLPGSLKIFEIIFSFIGFLMMLLFNSKHYFDLSRIYAVISGVALGISLFILIVNLLGVGDYLHAVLQFQKYFFLVWQMFIIGYSSIMLYTFNSYFHLLVGGITGLFLGVAFLADGIHGFNEPFTSLPR